MKKSRLLAIHLYGFVLVFVQTMGLALIIMWTLQMIALSFGENYDWAAVLQHLFLSISFAAFFPGQTFWTFRLRDEYGFEHTIIGRPAAESETAD